MNRWITTAVLAALATAAMRSATARADGFDADLGIGYSKLRIDGAGAKDLDKADGPAAHLAFTFGLPPTPPEVPLPGVRLGFDLNLAGFRDDYHVLDVNGFDQHRYNELDLVMPEFRVGAYLPIGHFFVQPSVGVGVALADFRTGHVHRRYFDDSDDHEDYYHDDDDRYRANVLVEPKIQAGLTFGRIAFGLEGSYMWTHLHFGDDIGGNVSTWYAGGFFRFRF